MQEVLLIAFSGCLAAVAFFVSLDPNRSGTTRFIARLLTRRRWEWAGFTTRTQLRMVTVVFSVVAVIGVFMLLD